MSIRLKRFGECASNVGTSVDLLKCKCNIIVYYSAYNSGEFSSRLINGSRNLWFLSLMILRSQHHQPLPCYLCSPWRGVIWLWLASVSRAISGESTFHPRIITIAGMEAVIDSLDSASGPCFCWMISVVRFKRFLICFIIIKH